MSVLRSEAVAQFDTLWTNPLIGDWFISGNWSNNVPSSFDDALIGNGGVAVISAPGAVTGQIYVAGSILGTTQE